MYTTQVSIQNRKPGQSQITVVMCEGFTLGKALLPKYMYEKNETFCRLPSICCPVQQPPKPPP